MAEAKKYTAEQIRDISEKVYRHRLGKDDVRRMIAKDGDNGEKLRSRCSHYDDLVRDIVTIGLS